jgi:hypothetical protein
MADASLPEKFEYKLVILDDSPLHLCAAERAFNPTDKAVGLWTREPGKDWKFVSLGATSDGELSADVAAPIPFDSTPFLNISYEIMDRPGGSDKYRAECAFTAGTSGLQLLPLSPGDQHVAATIQGNSFIIAGTFPGSWKRLIAQVALARG